MDTIAQEIKTALHEMGRNALIASRVLANLKPEAKNNILNKMADAIDAMSAEIIKANAKDLDAGSKAGLSVAMLDRLRLDEKRVREMSDGLRYVAGLNDPVGRVLSEIERPNGLKIKKISVPLGVIGIIYESRPNVTVDAAGLCLKAGNAVILRGGSEAFNSNMILAKCMNEAGVAAGLPDGAVQLVPYTDRQAISVLLKMDDYISLIIPRGGEGLIRTVVEQSTIPVIKHYKGVCHIYIDAESDLTAALSIVENAKIQRPSACNALETLLVDAKALPKFIEPFLQSMEKHGVELRADERFRKLAPNVKLASEADYYEEYLDLILAVKVVDSIDEAIAHINQYGSKHSDCIVTTNLEHAEKFMAEVDSATVYHNASTRFTDGSEFGMGAEIGISTDKLHARGPMGLEELTSYKYLIFGSGQSRE
ncbi:MAG: glutamate-5-semialdehyde dehydrogenase [Victivallaceae bacterium]|nr:glutamate-5-semialdehyde dehydrogenase [Victivallaceae bacterium]